MDQNQWFNTGSPAPMNDRQAFEAGWTAAQRQMAKNLCQSFGVSEQEAFQQAKSFFRIP